MRFKTLESEAKLISCKFKIGTIYFVQLKPFLILDSCANSWSLSSSSQALKNNHYGLSKKKSEQSLKDLNIKNKNTIYIYRLPNIFGKWSMPNYNSVVATFVIILSEIKK